MASKTAKEGRNVTMRYRVAVAEGASRCRRFTSKGRQCGQKTKRTVIWERDGEQATRTPDCGRHD